MFVRSITRGSRTYLQIVESQRQDGKIVQRVIANLGERGSYPALDRRGSVLPPGDHQEGVEGRPRAP